MAKTVFTEPMVSAIKRKNVKDMVVELLRIDGKEDEANEVADSSRLTNALMERTIFKDIEPEAEEQTDEAGPVADAEVEDNELIALFDELEKAIKKGKKKKAKKALQAIEDKGVTGSEIDKLKAKVKEL